jgi:hypothetical protein
MEWVSGNIYIRPMNNPNGMEKTSKIEGHTHNFDHTSIFFSGIWYVKRWKKAVDENGVQLKMPDGKEAWVLMDEFEREGPFHLLIEANHKHEFIFMGFRVPDWMNEYLSKLSEQDAQEFKDKYSLSLGKAWCVYSHRTPQGDISLDHTGWDTAYR